MPSEVYGCVDVNVDASIYAPLSRGVGCVLARARSDVAARTYVCTRYTHTKRMRVEPARGRNPVISDLKRERDLDFLHFIVHIVGFFAGFKIFLFVFFRRRK